MKNMKKNRKNLKILLLTFNFLTCFILEKKIIATSLKNEQIKNHLSIWTKSKVMTALREITEIGRPNKMVGTEGHFQILNFLKEKIKTLDPDSHKNFNEIVFVPDINYALSSYERDFREQIESSFNPSSQTYKTMKKFIQNVRHELNQLRNVKGHNLVWEKKGTEFPNETLIIGAHYDNLSVDPISKKILKKGEMPGADNNATGITILLNLIEFFSNHAPKRSIKIVFFDFEELGQLGSYDFLKKKAFNLKNTYFINLELLGHDSKIDDKKKGLGNFKAYATHEFLKDHSGWAKNFLGQGNKFSPNVNFELAPNIVNSTPFYHISKMGIPSLLLTQNWEDDFNQRGDHSPNDFVETLNWTTYYASFRLIVASSLFWAY